MIAAAKMQGKVAIKKKNTNILTFLWRHKVDEDDLHVTGHFPLLFSFSSVSAGKVVHAETTVAHAVLNGSQYYHQDWAHAAAHVIVPPLRIDPNTPGYLMGLLGKYVLITATNVLYLYLFLKYCTYITFVSYWRSMISDYLDCIVG